MQLIQRGKCLFTIRPHGRTVRCLRAIAATGVLVAGMAETESRAAISIVERSGRNTVSGRVTSFPRNDPNPPTAQKSYDVTKLAPAGIGSFTLNNSGATSVTGASSTANADLTTTITLNSLSDTLVVKSVASTSSSASASPTAELVANASAGGSMQSTLTFAIDNFYDYEIVIDELSAMVQGQILDAQSLSRIELGNFFVRQQRILKFPADPPDDRGSLVGTLTPGQYIVHSRASAGLRDIDATSASADYNFTLRLTPVGFERRWIDSGGGSFQGADNWSDPIVPGAQDVAVFDRPGTYTVQLDQAVTNKRLRANGGGVNVTFDLSGNDYVLDEIRLGGLDGDNGSITFDDTGGPVVSAASAVASDEGLAAAANGPAARLRARLLRAGKGWTANVTIPISTNLGTIDNGGRVNVKGANGRWEVVILTLGNEGAGRFEVSGGGQGQSERAVLGANGLDISEATITGQGSTWDSSTLVVGEKGFAILEIADKGLLTGGDIVIGERAGSKGRIEVSAASLLQKPTDSLTVGSEGLGTLDVIDGSKVEAGSLVMGRHGTGEGEATVGSNANLDVSAELSVGILGKAQLTVDGGGVVDRSGTGLGSTKIGGKGLVLVRGLFFEGRELTVNGTLEITTGQVEVGKISDLDKPGRLGVEPGGTLKGNGTIRGKLEVHGGVNQFGGQVLPGTSPGTLTIDGDYEQTGGRLGIEIAGTAPDQFDVLAVTGSALLGGTLLLEFIDGFAPRQGDEFKFLDIGGALSGAFDEVEVRNLLAGFQFDLRSDAGGLTMIALNDGVFVPEPATPAMLLAGLLAILFRRQVR